MFSRRATPAEDWGPGVASLRTGIVADFRARAPYRLALIAAFVAVFVLALIAAPSGARAQFNCVTNGADSTCTNNGTEMSPNSNTAIGGNATTINRGIAYGDVTVISAGGNATLQNSGSIFGLISVYGFGGGGSTVVTNSGLIDGRSSLGGFGVFLLPNGVFGTPSTLNILPGSRIFGFIVLAGAGGGPPSAVNIQSGGDISSTLIFGSCGCGGGLTDTGATVNVFGGAPYVISGNTVAVLDPTSFAVADRNVLDVTHTISSLIGGRLNTPASASGDTSGAAIGFAPSGNVASDMARQAFAGVSSLNYASNDHVLFNNPSVTAQDGTSVWAQGFGGQRVQEANAPTLRSVNNFYGGTLGIDKAISPQIRLGGFAGAGNVKSTIDLNSGNTNSDLAFGGVYGRYALAKSFIDFALLGGQSSNTTQRMSVNNLAPSGFETASAKYDGWFVSPEIAYGFRGQIGANLTLSPVARLRYLAANFGGYQESGSTSNLTVAGRTTHNFEERGEVTLTHTSRTTTSEQLQLSVTAGLLVLERVGDANVNAVLLGQSLAFATPGKNNILGGYSGIGFDWRHARGVSLFGAAEFTAMTDSSHTITGKAGIRVAF